MNQTKNATAATAKVQVPKIRVIQVTPPVASDEKIQVEEANVKRRHKRHNRHHHKHQKESVEIQIQNDHDKLFNEEI